jgi:hypothetical protein
MVDRVRTASYRKDTLFAGHPRAQATRQCPCPHDENLFMLM